jgi:putative flippase GtrA
VLISQAWLFARSNRKEVKRFAKFAIVGAAGSVTDLILLNLLVQFVGLRPVVANVFSFAAAVIQNFSLNRKWTFPESRERQATTQLAQFAVVSLLGLGLNTLILGVVDHLLIDYWVGWVGDPKLGFTLSYNFAKLFAIGVVLFWNFGANRLWTYRGLAKPA